MTTAPSATQRAEGREPVRAPSRAGLRRLAAVAVIALLVGVGLARFLYVQPSPVPTAPVGAVDLATVVTQLEAVVSQRPDDLRAWQQLGDAYLRRANASGDPAFTELADRALRRATALDPDDAATLTGLGSLAIARHEFGEGLQFGRRAAAAAPFDATALGVVVDAEVELGRYDAAAEDLQTMVDLDPGLPALARVSYLRELHGDLDGAARVLSRAQTAGSGAPADAAAVAVLAGDVHLRRDDLDAAAASYDRASRLVEGLPGADIGRARVLAARGDRAAAIRLLDDVVEATPQPAAATLLAELLALDGRADDADDARALVRSMTDLAAASGQVVDLELAAFESDHGDPAEAVRLARRAYEGRPDHVNAADTLAWALHRAGDGDEAVELLPAVLALDTADPRLHLHAASILAADGDVRAARDALGTAFTLPPWFSFGAAGEAVELARELDVPVPDRWVLG